jgi:ribosomal protein S27AE
VAKKKYDPLWEIVDEKVALQGAEPDVDALCPSCHVTVHLGLGAKAGERYECGLCGGVSEVIEEQPGVALKLLV